MKKVIAIMTMALMTSGAAFADDFPVRKSFASTDGNTAMAGSLAGSKAAGIVTGEAPVINVEASDGVHYSGEYKMKNTPSMAAPSLTTTMTETCMGSSSGGVAVAGFGATIGSTWRDNACVRRLDARQLNALGYRLGAKELMCDSDAVRDALKRAGTPCYADLPEDQKRPEDRAVIAPVPVVAPAEDDTPALGEAQTKLRQDAVNHNETLWWMDQNG